MKRVLALLIAMVVHGCSSDIIAGMSSEKLAYQSSAYKSSQDIPAFEVGLTPLNVIALGMVTATSCKARPWERALREQAAVDDLRQQTRSRGGNAIGNLFCETESASCLASVICRGTALQRDVLVASNR